MLVIGRRYRAAAALPQQARLDQRSDSRVCRGGRTLPMPPFVDGIDHFLIEADYLFDWVRRSLALHSGHLRISFDTRRTYPNGEWRQAP
jgi:hypothetical protein